MIVKSDLNGFVLHLLLKMFKRRYKDELTVLMKCISTVNFALFCIKPVLGSHMITSLDSYAIRRLINQMIKNRCSADMIVSRKGIISKSLKYAKRMRWAARNEALKVELPSWNASRKLRCKIRMPLQ